MSFVIDTSVAATWLLPDESHQIAEAALERLRHEKAFVPALFHYEITNVMRSNERRGRIDETATSTTIMILQSLQLETVHNTDYTKWMELARKHSLTAYDACYLHLAMERQTPLYTLDRQLLRALADYPALVPTPLAPSPRAV